MDAIVEVASATLTFEAAQSVVVRAIKQVTSYVSSIFAGATSAVAFVLTTFGSIANNAPNSLNFEGGLISAA